MKLIKKKKTLWLFLILITILFIGVGYASINSITGEIKGTVIAEVQTGVFITNVEYVSNVDANLTTSNIDYYIGTMLQSTVELSDTNPNSQIQYKVTVHNNSEETMTFVDVLYDNEFYDNQDIVFEISGFTPGQEIGPYENKEIIITFKYKNAEIPENNVLKSYLNFNIKRANRLVLANDVESTENYLTSSVPKEQIETIKFEQGEEPTEGIISKFDASEKQDESIIGYYTDVDNNDLYELTFVSNETIFTNKNSQYLFSNLTNVTRIELDNFSTLGTSNMSAMFFGNLSLIKLDVSLWDTSKAINMSNMFSYCRKLNILDVSNWNTSEVTNMAGMFYACNELDTLNVSNWITDKVTDMSYMLGGGNKLSFLDVSKWNTSLVSNMSYMFQNDTSLNTLDVSNWDTSAVTNMSYMFSGCGSLNTLDVSNWKTSAVTNMGSMFQNDTSLNKNDKIRMYEKSKITMYKHTFFFVYFFRRYTKNGKTNYTIKDIERNEFKTKLFSFS